MTRLVPILAALAALCAPPASAATLKPSTLACERAEQQIALMEIVQRPRSDANRDEFNKLLGALTDLGYCVKPPAGTGVTVIERHDSHLVKVYLTSDARPMYVLPTSIDWSAR